MIFFYWLQVHSPLYWASWQSCQTIKLVKIWAERIKFSPVLWFVCWPLGSPLKRRQCAKPFTSCCPSFWRWPMQRSMRVVSSDLTIKVARNLLMNLLLMFWDTFCRPCAMSWLRRAAGKFSWKLKRKMFWAISSSSIGLLPIIRGEFADLKTFLFKVSSPKNPIILSFLPSIFIQNFLNCNSGPQCQELNVWSVWTNQIPN